jgi:hypothetical protein
MPRSGRRSRRGGRSKAGCGFVPRPTGSDRWRSSPPAAVAARCRQCRVEAEWHSRQRGTYDRPLETAAAAPDEEPRRRAGIDSVLVHGCRHRIEPSRRRCVDRRSATRCARSARCSPGKHIRGFDLECPTSSCCSDRRRPVRHGGCLVRFGHHGGAMPGAAEPAPHRYRRGAGLVTNAKDFNGAVAKLDAASSKLS